MRQQNELPIKYIWMVQFLKRLLELQSYHNALIVFDGLYTVSYIIDVIF